MVIPHLKDLDDDWDEFRLEMLEINLLNCIGMQSYQYKMKMDERMSSK